MNIIGKTLEGDLIIQVSQAEWDGLRDGIRPKNDRYLSAEEANQWQKTEVYQGLDTMKLPGLRWLLLGRSLKRGRFDGTWESLAAFGFTEPGIGKLGQEKLRDIARQQVALKNEPRTTH